MYIYVVMDIFVPDQWEPLTPFDFVMSKAKRLFLYLVGVYIFHSKLHFVHFSIRLFIFFLLICMSF